MQVYGSKVYVAVSTSSLIDVINAETATSIKQIPLFANGIASQPRQIACHNGKVYVCCFDGSVVKIDTVSLQIEATATAGRNPDGICIANNKLYVSNSGGLDFPNYDSTVSVFDLNTFSETKKITVKINPATIKADKYGNIYVVSKGNYEDISPCLQQINTATDQVEHLFEIEVAGFDIYNNSMYFYTYDYSTRKALYQIFDLSSKTITNTNFITENSLPKTPYGIDVNPYNGDIYITDALDYTSVGDVYCFSKEGKKKFQFEAGMIPKKVISN
jgi:DNA-binding beta-propeller fold protein YncE